MTLNIAAHNYKWPLSQASKIPRCDSDNYLSNRIVALNIGTYSTSLSIAYSSCDKSQIFVPTFDDAREECSNSLLLKQVGNSIILEGMGETANCKFSSIKLSDHDNYIYFDEKKYFTKEKVST